MNKQKLEMQLEIDGSEIDLLNASLQSFKAGHLGDIKLTQEIDRLLDKMCYDKTSMKKEEEHPCKGGINIPGNEIEEHKTDGTPCWCNPRVVHEI